MEYSKILYHAPTQIYSSYLRNGLKVLIQERHILPLVTVMLCYHVGGRDSLNGITGLAHFVEHMLFKGTEKLPKGSIDEITQKLGGYNNAFTTQDYTCYHFNICAENWETVLEIEADRMQNCRWSEQEFEAEKRVILEELNSNDDSPSSYFGQMAESFFYSSHPYRNPILGWKQDLKDVSLSQLYQFYRQHYMPNNCFLVIVGDIDPHLAIEKVAKHFAHISPQEHPFKRTIRENFHPYPREVKFFHQVSLPEFIYMLPIFPCTHLEDYSLDLFSIILGEGKSSRLYRSMVKENELLHSVGAWNNLSKDAGNFCIGGELRPHVSPEEIQTFLESELRKFIIEPICEYEFQKAKNVFSAGIIFSQATNADIAEKIVIFETMVGYKELGNIQQYIERISIPYLHKVARKFLQPKRSAIAWLLPKNKKVYKPLSKKKNIEFPMPSNFQIPPSLLQNRKLDIRFSSNIHRNDICNPYMTEFKNGLKLIVLESQILPEVIVSLEFEDIGVNEFPQGTAFLFGCLLAEGTQQHTSKEIAEIMQLAGGHLNTKCDEIRIHLLSQDVELGISLLAEIARKPKFDEKSFKQQKRKMLITLESMKEDPYFQAGRAFKRLIYGNQHPYGMHFLGTAETIKKIKQEHIVSFHQKYFSPKQAVIIVVGNVVTKDIDRLVAKYFEDWEGKDIIKEPLPILTLQNEPKEELIPLAKEQLVVFFGHLGVRLDNPDLYKLLILEHILGGGTGFTDRLSKRIRDELGLCYQIGARISSSADVEEGTFDVSLATTPEHYPLAMQVLQEEIYHIQKSGIRMEELNNTQKFLQQRIIAGMETNNSVMNYLSDCYFRKLGFDYRNKIPAIISQVTCQDVQEVAQKYLHPHLATTVVAGPVQKLKQKIVAKKKKICQNYNG